MPILSCPTQYPDVKKSKMSEARRLFLSKRLACRLEGLPYRAGKFLLFRIARFDCPTAMRLSNTSRGMYNSWFKNKRFARVYRQLVLCQRVYKPIIKNELEELYEIEQVANKFNTVRGCF